MSEKLTPEELKKIKAVQNYSQAYYWLKVKELSNFNLGDVLVKMMVKKWAADGEASTYEPENVSHKSHTPRKYKVVHIDEFNVPFVKLVKADGKLGCELVCLAEQNPQYAFFKVDPEYVEHTILADEGEVFVLDQRLKEVKRQRRLVQKQNKAIREKISTLAEAEEFLKNAKVGDKFWIAGKGNDDAAHVSTYQVSAVTSVTAKKSGTSWMYGGGRSSSPSGIYRKNEEIDELINIGLHTYHEVHFKTINKTNANSSGLWGWYDKWMDPHVVLECYIYKTQPSSYEAKIQ